MGNYKSISIPENLRDEVKELIFNKAFLGYRSVSEFCTTAIREAVNRASLQESCRPKIEKGW